MQYFGVISFLLMIIRFIALYSFKKDYKKLGGPYQSTYSFNYYLKEVIVINYFFLATIPQVFYSMYIFVCSVIIIHDLIF